MKRLFFALVVLLLIPLRASAQRQVIPSGATLPTTCNVGEIFVLSVSPIGVHHCIAANTWQAIRITTPVGVLDGGLALTASIEDAIPIGDGIAAYITGLLPSCSGGSDALTYNNTTDTFGCNTIAGGSGDAVSVNGSPVTDANFNDVAPAAPVAGLNVTWLFDTVASPDDVSAYLPFDTAFFFKPAGQLSIKDGSIGDLTLRNSGALSVIGRSANSAGAPADIAATAASAAVLRESGSTIGFGTVATAGIANDAVTYAKIQNISATQRVLGRNAVGAGDTEELTVSQVLDWISATQGAVLFRGATTWSALAPGTAGNQLTTNGAGADPTWAVAGGGGSGVQFREFYICAPGNTALAVCQLYTNKTAAFVEVTNNASRSHLDLSGFTDFRILVQMAVAAVAADVEIQCDTSSTFASPTVLGQITNPTTTFTVGAWTTIPAGECKTTDGQYMRAGMINGNGVEDPSVRLIRLQVK